MNYKKKLLKFIKGPAVLVILLANNNISYSQSADVKISNADAINNFFYKIPLDVTDQTGEGGAVTLVGGTKEDCANLALKRLQRNIYNITKSDAIVTAVNGLFSALGVIVPGGYAKYALVAAKMTFKALTAGDADKFEEDAIKEAIKQIGAAGLEIKDSKALTKALKELYKKIIDKMFGDKKELINYNKPPLDPCQITSLIVEIVPPKEGEPMNQFTLQFTADEQCNCKYPPKELEPAFKLKSYNIWGTMTITIDSIEYVKRTWPIKDDVKVTLSYGNPHYNVRAECDCGDISFTPTETVCSQSNEVVLLASYVHFGDNSFHYNSFGGSGEFTRFIKPQLGATIDAGIYFHKESQNQATQNYTQMNITGGITYLPVKKESGCDSKFVFSTHALFGISSYMQKASYNGNTNNSTLHSFTMNIGAAADWKISKQIKIRLPQVDYAPTFFGSNTQNNFRISAGADLRF
ncbi:MAG: hypothetical protein ACHQEB_01325 [Chitinophagales bacterium]